MIHAACTFHTSFPLLKEILTVQSVAYICTQLHGLHVSLLVYLQKISFQPSPQQYMCRKVNQIMNNQARYSDIYSQTYIAAHYPFWIHPHIHQICIHGCIYYPQLSTFIYTCVKHVNIPVTTANTPIDRRLDGHALQLTLTVAQRHIGPYITTQASGIHTISRRMDDERKQTSLPWRRGM